jgi:hypothetical protein
MYDITSTIILKRTGKVISLPPAYLRLLELGVSALRKASVQAKRGLELSEPDDRLARDSIGKDNFPFL